MEESSDGDSADEINNTEAESEERSNNYGGITCGVPFCSLMIFLLEQKLLMAWQQNLAKAMASPRKLHPSTPKRIQGRQALSRETTSFLYIFQG